MLLQKLGISIRKRALFKIFLIAQRSKLTKSLMLKFIFQTKCWAFKGQENMVVVVNLKILQ